MAAWTEQVTLAHSKAVRIVLFFIRVWAISVADTERTSESIPNLESVIHAEPSCDFGRSIISKNFAAGYFAQPHKVHSIQGLPEFWKFLQARPLFFKVLFQPLQFLLWCHFHFVTDSIPFTAVVDNALISNGYLP